MTTSLLSNSRSTTSKIGHSTEAKSSSNKKQDVPEHSVSGTGRQVRTQKGHLYISTCLIYSGLDVLREQLFLLVGPRSNVRPLGSLSEEKLRPRKDLTPGWRIPTQMINNSIPPNSMLLMCTRGREHRLLQAIALTVGHYHTPTLPDSLRHHMFLWTGLERTIRSHSHAPASRSQPL